MSSCFKALPFLGKYRIRLPSAGQAKTTGDDVTAQGPAVPTGLTPKSQKPDQPPKFEENHSEQMKQHKDLIAKIQQDLQEQSKRRREAAQPGSNQASSQ